MAASGGSISVEAPFAPQTVGVSFLGADKTESPFRPPDTMGAVGPSQVLVFVNGRIKVFSKTGTLGALNSSTDTFFNAVRNGSSVSDPRVRYDRLSGRWFLSIITVSTPNKVCLAVSNGSTITSATSFTFFQFQHDMVGLTPNIDTGQFADYDSLGVDQNALYVGINVFNAAGTAFLGSTGFVVKVGPAGRHPDGLGLPRLDDLLGILRSRPVCSAGRGQRRPRRDGGLFHRPRCQPVLQARDSKDQQPRGDPVDLCQHPPDGTHHDFSDRPTGDRLAPSARFPGLSPLRCRHP
jgi:hypothetical protein